MSGSDKVPQRRRASIAHVPPLADEELANAQDVVDLARSFTGHVPTSFRIMARKPAILRTFVRLVAAVISLFGWLSRWNDTLASDLEPAPLNFASAHLRPTGWSPGKHASS